MTKRNKVAAHMPIRNVAKMSNEQFARHRIEHLKFQIKKLNDARREYEVIAAQYGEVSMERSHIIMLDGAFIKFRPVGDGLGAIPTVCPVELATRFTKDAADNITSSLNKPEGAQGSLPPGVPSKLFESINITLALQQTIQGHKDAVAFLTAEVQNIKVSLSAIH